MRELLFKQIELWDGFISVTRILSDQSVSYDVRNFSRNASVQKIYCITIKGTGYWPASTIERSSFGELDKPMPLIPAGSRARARARTRDAILTDRRVYRVSDANRAMSRVKVSISMSGY